MRLKSADGKIAYSPKHNKREEQILELIKRIEELEKKASK